MPISTMAYPPELILLSLADAAVIFECVCRQNPTLGWWKSPAQGGGHGDGRWQGGH
jgi:hypothetical protein